MMHAPSTPGLEVCASLLRKEDARHLHGRGQFVSDVRLANTQDVAFVRSPHAHARIKSITIPPDAEGRVFTARDLPRLAEMRAVPQVNGFKVSGYPPLATQKVRYVGDAIAACMAPTRAEAEDLANSVNVDFEVLPAVIDAAAALTTTPSLVHESWANNLFIERVFQEGNLDEVARTADVVVRRTYRMNRQATASLEGRGVLAYWDYRYDESWFTCRPRAAHRPDRNGPGARSAGKQIRVIAPDVGGGFGGKNRICRKGGDCRARHEVDHPVRWVEDRREHLLASVHARPPLSRPAYAESAARCSASRASYVDAGAYSLWPTGSFMEAAWPRAT